LPGSFASGPKLGQSRLAKNVQQLFGANVENVKRTILRKAAAVGAGTFVDRQLPIFHRNWKSGAEKRLETCGRALTGDLQNTSPGAGQKDASAMVDTGPDGQAGREIRVRTSLGVKPAIGIEFLAGIHVPENEVSVLQDFVALLQISPDSRPATAAPAPARAATRRKAAAKNVLVDGEATEVSELVMVQHAVSSRHYFYSLSPVAARQKSAYPEETSASVS
jgi:hypothetical protein